MPSPIAQCKKSVVLLVVSLFLLDCAVPSSVGSTVHIRGQTEENNDLPKHNAAKKKGENMLGYVPLFLPLPRLLQIATPRNQ